MSARDSGRKQTVSESDRKWIDKESQLKKPFDKSLIKWFEGDNGKYFATVDPREYENRLDEIFGHDWYSEPEAVQGGVVKVVVYLKIDGEWIGRSSLGENDFSGASWTAKESQAFKRACSKWGLGRHLYGLNEERASEDDTLVLRNSGYMAYMEDWPDKQAELCLAVSNGDADDIDQLNTPQCRKLIYGIHHRVSTDYLDMLSSISPQEDGDKKSWSEEWSEDEGEEIDFDMP